ncbi:MAG TPA: HDOD domain-containing protein [Arenimonas sp.]|nr:HDOD domain-containing protein [Arenimonas sp.]
MSGKGEVVGYEFHVGLHSLQRGGAAPKLAAAAGYVAALMMAVRMCAQSGRVGFAELPLVALNALDEVGTVPQGTLLALQFDAPVADPDAVGTQLRRWRAAGARIGWRSDALHGLPESEKPDFLLVVQGGRVLTEVLKEIRERKIMQAALPILAFDLDGIDALESALQAGADYACCVLAARSDPAGAGQIAPQSQRVLQLLNSIVRDAPTDELVAAIKADVGLSYRLLRYLNSAGVGRRQEIGSIQQAVVALGRDELYRWLSVLLVRVSSGRPISVALQEMALARARFLELLAEAAREPKPGELFTLGTTSMLGQLLSSPLARVVESLALPESTRLALLEGAGTRSVYLELAEAVSEPDSERFQRLACEFGGRERVLAMSAEAWQFAANPEHA